MLKKSNLSSPMVINLGDNDFPEVKTILKATLSME